LGKPTGLAKKQLRALGRLKALSGLSGFYLAGGSAVAFHLRHRRSLDLDIFSRAPCANLDDVRARVCSAIRGAAVVSHTQAVLRLKLGDLPVDLVSYPYPPLDAPQPGPEGFPVAGLRDLAAMKLAAIARRGTKRDFWDLWAILVSGMTLREAAAAYATRFGAAEADVYHVARALTYFTDAEGEPASPAGMTSRRWEEIKAFFRAEAPSMLRR
jgi:hypothetical protein